MNKESLGKLVVNDGKVYEVIGYIEDPCLILKERATGIEKTVVIGSRESMNYIDIKDYIAALNDEVEIIEEDKKIYKLDWVEGNTFNKIQENSYLSRKEIQLLDSNFKELGNKINEIIDKLNAGVDKE